jgi:spore coat protein U-like protein
MRQYLALVVLFLLPMLSFGASCTSISVTGLVFGNYSGAAIPITATLTVTCPSGLAYELALGPGDSGVATARYMESGAYTLNYAMYQDAAHSIPWGDVNPTSEVAGTGTGSAQSYTIFGLLAAGQLLTPGSYTDVVNASVAGGPAATLQVSTMILSSCLFSSTGSMGFGSYTGVEIDITSSISVTCTNTTAYNLGVDDGQNSTGSYNWAMIGPGSALLAYQIWQNSQHTKLWGSTPGTDTLPGTGTGSAQMVSVYGVVSAGHGVTPGSYTDTITLNCTY